MKRQTLRLRYKVFLTMSMVVLFQMISWAQENAKVEINGNDVGSWFGRNWIWVAAIMALLVLLLLLGGGTSRKISKTTTYRKDDGSVVNTTTTETENN